MTEAEWLVCGDPKALLNVPGRLLSPRKHRLLAVACCRMAWEHVTSEDLRTALDLFEQYADNAAGSGPFRNAAARADARARLLRDQIAIGTEPHSAKWVRALVAQAIAEAGRPFARSDLAIARVRDAMRHVCDTDGAMADLLRDIFGNPFRPTTFAPQWGTDTAIALARQMYDSRDFSAMPILADALQDAGCDESAILDHCRGTGPHVRGCWVVDLVLGKQ